MATPSKADQEIVSLARSRYDLASQALDGSRNDELDDLRFMAASPDNQWQWPDDVLATRGAVEGQTINARPCLTINKLPQHVRQVTNDQRQNRPSGKVIPVDDRADPDVATILNGVIRHIEYMSDADVAYDTACENQVTYGEGYFRILTDYCDENSFDQDIRIGRIRNSFSVYMDPTIQDPCGSDAKWCLISHDMLKDEYEAAYPNATAVTKDFLNGIGDQGISKWITEKSVRVAEYYYLDQAEDTLVLLDVPGLGQRTVLKSAQEYQLAIAPPYPSRVLKERKTTVTKVKYCKINGYEILERKDWVGKWIPVIRVVGNEWEVDGELIMSGIIRNAKDAQRMYNYWTSQEAEMLALAPKAPFIGYAGQFEGFETQWKTANINNWPYLEVNPEVTDHEGKPLPKPERAAPPLPQSGLLQAKMGAADDIKGTTGQYDASLGAQSNETSGRAITAREKQGDTGTYHYVDNLAKAIRFGVRQMIDLIPKIYDTKRIARIIGIDGEIDHVMVDPSQQAPKVEVKDPETGAVLKRIYNFGIGKYDVMATTGPSYLTKRQETSDAMIQLSQGASDPTMALVMKYFAIKNMDFPEAQEFAAVLKKLAPAGLLDSGDESPEVIKLKQMVEQQGGSIQELKNLLQEAARSIDLARTENDEFKADIQAYRAETERWKVMADSAAPEQIAALVRKTVAEVLTSPDITETVPPRAERVPPEMTTPQPPMPPAAPPAQPGVM